MVLVFDPLKLGKPLKSGQKNPRIFHDRFMDSLDLRELRTSTIGYYLKKNTWQTLFEVIDDRVERLRVKQYLEDVAKKSLGKYEIPENIIVTVIKQLTHF